MLSHAAFRLHSFGILNSIRQSNSGFISDDYLNAIDAETTVSAMELVTAGLWERREDGYAVVSGAMIAQLQENADALTPM